MSLDTDTAIEWARAYRNKDDRAGKALRALADAVIELRAENRLLRELACPRVPEPSESPSAGV